MVYIVLLVQYVCAYFTQCKEFDISRRCVQQQQQQHNERAQSSVRRPVEMRVDYIDVAGASYCASCDVCGHDDDRYIFFFFFKFFLTERYLLQECRSNVLYSFMAI